MCGIFGLMGAEHIDREAFEKNTLRLHHRGPDEHGCYISDDQSLAFGHTRLSIIDLEHGSQPLHSHDGNLHLVANGEIYNYLELAKELPEQAENSLSQSDCEAILQCYQAYGEDGFKSVFGMFSFALYDETNKRSYLCRDRLGIKPLFYCHNANGLAFASEIKALLPLCDDKSINPNALGQFLQHQFNTGRDTIFNSIKRVLPGEYIAYENNELRHHQYWSANDVHPIDLSLDEAKAQFDSLFTEVMDQHLRSDVPMGLFLSGGLDSSILLARLAEHYQDPIRTYSIGYSGTSMDDELDGATAQAKRFNTRHHALRVSRDDLFSRIVHSIWAADDLMRDYASLPTHALSESASADLKVVFSGEGGDEVFAGYRRYQNKLSRLLLHNVLKQPFTPNNQWHTFSRNNALSEALKQCDINADYRALWKSCPSNWSLMAKRQLIDIRASLCDNLFVKTDRMMMAFGLEGRVPFSDHRIVEFGLSLPDKLKYQDHLGKFVLRQWAEKYLPKDNLHTAKRGFNVPIKEWLTDDFLHQLHQKILNNSAIKQWFSIQGVDEVFKAHKSGKNFSREIWGLMQFAIWHRLFIENPSTIPNTHENPLDWV